MSKEIELKAGETAVIKITPYLEYRVTHNGWNLEVISSKSIGVRPVGDKRLSIISIGPVEEDEI